MTQRGEDRRGFTLIELLICLAIIAVLIGLLLPALRATRTAARQAACLSNEHQLIVGWTGYSVDFKDRAMPLAYTSAADVGTGRPIYWWGVVGTSTSNVDPTRGFLAPYLGATPAQKSVFECPAQPWGTYLAQGASREPTSTYGYNGYYLSPAKTPGWAGLIGHRPWRRVTEIARPEALFVFADALLPMSPARNSALLDPPLLWDGEAWYANPFPTTSFRHGTWRSGTGQSDSARADGSVRGVRARPEWIVHPEVAVGSAGETNDPHYVPDAAEWTAP
jgi:prepilin-type N-terminal cleavage/methylation domain-containing protein